MSAEEDAWRTLTRTPTTEQDLRETAEASRLLVPSTLTLHPARTEMSFHLQENWYRDGRPVFLEDGEDQACRYCLTGFGVVLGARDGGVCRPIRSDVPAELHELNEEWNSPRHSIIRRLLMVHDESSFWLQDPLGEQRTPEVLRGLHIRLCELAAARLNGPVHAIASQLAGTWTASPGELVRTAEAIALPA
jgi:hypothetical protein